MHIGRNFSNGLKILCGLGCEKDANHPSIFFLSIQPHTQKAICLIGLKVWGVRDMERKIETQKKTVRNSERRAQNEERTWGWTKNFTINFYQLIYRFCSNKYGSAWLNCIRWNWLLLCIFEYNIWKLAFEYNNPDLFLGKNRLNTPTNKQITGSKKNHVRNWISILINCLPFIRALMQQQTKTSCTKYSLDQVRLYASRWCACK